MLAVLAVGSLAAQVSTEETSVPELELREDGEEDLREARQERLEAVKDGATVGFGAAGAGLAGGIVFAYVGAAATPLLCTPRPPVDEDHGGCPAFVYGVIGAGVGAIGAEIVAASLITSAVDRGHRPVLRTSLLTLGIGGSIALVTVPSRDPAPLIAGSMVAALGIPVTAGIAAGLAPETGYAAMALVPDLGPHGPGVRLVGQF